jgi:hypothetical protein
MATRKPTLDEKPTTKKHGGARPGTGGAMPGAGRPEFEIAVLVRDGIHIDTLRKHFSNELVAGKAKANSGIGRTLFQKAMGGDTTAMIWWSKTQMRWAETQKHELTGADGAPLEFAKIERVIVKNG